jgi:hypothetical protein
VNALEIKHHPRLTASELATLWNTYMADTMGKCVLIHFKKTVEDEKIEKIIDFALRIAEDHIDTITNLFHNEEIPIPEGFSEKDVNENAPRLFADAFYLRYLEIWGEQGYQLMPLPRRLHPGKISVNIINYGFHRRNKCLIWQQI